MLVRELMTTDPVTVTQDTPVKVALGLLAQSRDHLHAGAGTTRPSARRRQRGRPDPRDGPG